MTEEQAREILTKARNKQSNNDDSLFLRWAIGEPPIGSVCRMDYESALYRVSTSAATDEDLEILSSLI